MTHLTPTRHAVTRMAQRGVTLKDAELIAMIGTEIEGGYLVRNKDYSELERALKTLLKNFKRVVGKRLVVVNGQIVTTFHATDVEHRRLLRRSRELDCLE